MVCLSLVMMLLLSAITMAPIVNGSDPDIISDFILPPNTTVATPDFFTYTAMRSLVNGAPPPTFKVTKATMAEFPALNGQSVSFAVLQFPVDSINPPHTHPRSAELLFLTYGSLEVGFVDTAGKLYTQTLQEGDMFVFPKGLVHYQYNPNNQSSAVAVSAFASASAGTLSVPVTVFTTGIPEDILAKSFKTEVATVEKIIAGLTPKT